MVKIDKQYLCNIGGKVVAVFFNNNKKIKAKIDKFD